MSMNPRETTNKIRNDYEEYLSSILYVKDDEITQKASECIKNAEFVKGPYLEITLPFKNGKSLKELVDENLISKEFQVMGKDVHYDEWNLRIHQETALRKIIQEEKNIVVSTGTGSGKTECYLYPIFNELMREKEAGTLDPGVRALLIFPMNALANDHQKKLRKLLRNYPDITFGRYTGETKHVGRNETPEMAEKRLHEEYDIQHAGDLDASQRTSIKNELMCREMMAKNPPHILLTNYAMLEFMLLRPDTAPFFDNDSAKNWRFIVIDEAHTYKGANGTEIALLLRRVKERIRAHMNKPFRCIATSATLGNKDALGGLAKFAESLFGEPFEASDVVTTERIKRIPNPGSKMFSPEDYVRLKNQTKDKSEEERGIILYNELINDLRIFSLYDALNGSPKKLSDISEVVFEDLSSSYEREQALINLIELAAAARLSDNDSALLPARYHLFVKSLEGMFVQYYPEKKVFLDRREINWTNDTPHAVFEIANCQKCSHEYLIGKQNNNKFVQSTTVEKPDYLLIGENDQESYSEYDEDDFIEENYKLQELEKLHLCLNCGTISQFGEKHPNCCNADSSKKIVTAYKLKYSGKAKESNCCPCCGAIQKGVIKRFLTANQPATFAIAKSLYDAIPPRPINIADLQKSSNPTTDDLVSELFDDDLFVDDLFEEDTSENSEIKVSSEYVDESGRKLLIFSDNRQEAAFFAGFFEKRYNTIMWRKVIIQCLKEAGEALCVSDLIERVQTEADERGLYSFDLSKDSYLSNDEKKRMAAHYIMQEFLSPESRTGLEGLGYIHVLPAELPFKAGVSIAGITDSDLKNLFSYMMDTLREKGAVTYPKCIRATDDFFSPRNHTGSFRQSGSDTVSDGYIYGFIPDKSRTNKRLTMIKKVLTKDPNVNQEEIDTTSRSALDTLFKAITYLVKHKYVEVVNHQIKGTGYRINSEKWKIRYVEDNDKLYRCKDCGKVSHYSIRNVCPVLKCHGELEEIPASVLKQNPYYNGIYSDSKLIPMLAREHTAQLSADTAREYQEKFEQGRINVLSCSTTFEMGVDVGELEATFLRNVPPETSNYIQRAGRAGRRTSSAAFSVTFSRRSSHDLTYFKDPTKIIAGNIKTPVLEISNKKIAERHLNSIVVSWLFKKHRVFFDGKARAICGDGDANSNMASIMREELMNHPSELLDSIKNVFPASLCEEMEVDKWKFIDNLVGKEGVLTKAIENRTGEVKSLRDYFDKEIEAQRTGNAGSANRLINTLDSEDSISFLSAKGVLPKYGFPIDSVNLDILSSSEEEAKKIDLSRDLKVAISEFAPPSQIVANGKVWSSYAINTVPNKSWPTHIYYTCSQCGKIDVSDNQMVDISINLKTVPPRMCESCKKPMTTKKYIVPLFGFSTKMGDMPKSVGDTKPSKYYGTQIQFKGIDNLTEREEAEVMNEPIQLTNGIVDRLYSPGGKLCVLNQGNNGAGLLVCPKCGYATDITSMNKGQNHESRFNRQCKCGIVCVSLGHEFSTDILRLRMPFHTNSTEYSSKNVGESILYALIEGACEALDINRSDIDGCLTNSGDYVLFDDTAGGSGYVKQIYDNFEKVLYAALDKVSGKCGCTEETSCYGCLRCYSNQHYHDNLSRGLAKDYFEWLLGV